MAENVTLGGDGSLFVGEDKTVELELFLKSDPTVAVSITGWTMVLDVRKKDNSPPPAILSLTPTIIGTFNSLRSSNTQRAVFTFTDDDLNLFKEQTYRWSWKRLDDGSETVLAWGDFTPQKATAP